ncbi:hypothetical protein PAMP_008324 [Pampus punctatissimus]
MTASRMQNLRQKLTLAEALSYSSKMPSLEQRVSPRQEGVQVSSSAAPQTQTRLMFDNNCELAASRDV